MRRLPLLIRLLHCYDGEPDRFRRIRLALVISKLERAIWCSIK
jgi:hypothetical protein